MSEQENLNRLRDEATTEIESANSSQELEELRTKFLGRKGQLTLELRKVGSLSPEERKNIGQAVNDLKQELSASIDMRIGVVATIEVKRKHEQETIDVTLPGRSFQVGHPHILVETLQRVKNIFIGLGYEFVETPEVEEYRFNFEALNYPEEHPAIDEQMSFYITDDRLLRTHTTAYQHRVMKNRKPPIRACTIGKCYRVDAVDATHGHTFHQVDCFMVDKNVTMSDLKGTLQQFAIGMFGPDVKVRFRPDFFPFVEPGAEVAVTCTICKGSGCNVCKGTGWLELAGAGMIHPNVLSGAGIDPEEYTGFAFGFGIERMPMLKHGIGDLRLFMENDLRFLRQL